MKRDTDFYLLLLERLLLEIRNLEDSQLSDARSLAYIFHNIPGVLRCNFDEEAAQEAYAIIRSRAQHFGMDEWIEEWERWAYRKMDEDRSTDVDVLARVGEL